MALAFFRTEEDERLPSKMTEKRLANLTFTVHKLNHRQKPTRKDRIKIVCCFSEFGCEVVGSLYCIPRLLKRFPGAYVIAVGWYGREYLYRHLVDEFWELKEEEQKLIDRSKSPLQRLMQQSNDEKSNTHPHSPLRR